LIEWQNEQTIFKTNSITLQFTPLSFDVHFQEIFSTLTLGGKLVLIKEELRLDTYALLKTLSENNVNRLFLPYVALNHLSEIAVMHGLFPDSLKEVTTAGEQLKITPNIRSFFNKIPGAVLYNHYGPSETHVVTSLTLTGNADLWPNLPTIGKSISNVNTFILDENLNPVAKGSEGDIYLGGVCLANGYLHSPELTAERFLVKRNFVLNEETLKGKWKEARGEIQKMWGKLTDDDLDQAKGDLTALTGIIQQRYGESKESVQTKLNDYFGNAWTDVKQGVAKTAEKAKNAVSEASESAKQKL
jgi:non-ribosomal peptide synthetase component F/uncharacterized protein YjbJ (UPF0337 family)